MRSTKPSGRSFIRLAALLAAAGIGIAVIAAIALKVMFPPEKLRALVLDKASEHLKREVKLDTVSLGLVKGLVLEGFEVSEQPEMPSGATSFSRKVVEGRPSPLMSSTARPGRSRREVIQSALASAALPPAA